MMWCSRHPGRRDQPDDRWDQQVTARGDTPIFIEGPWSHRSVSANGTRFHVAESGDGPLVLLLHGFPEFWWTWREQLSSLQAAGFRAVAVDLRGYGGSDKPPRGYDLVTAASDAAGLIRALGEANAVLVGHDWGGLIAWSVAAYYPKVVRRRAAGRADAQRLVRAGLAGRGHGADLPRRDAPALGGALGPGVPPLVRPVQAAPGRAALRAQPAGPGPGAHLAPARVPGLLRAAGHGPGVGPVCRCAVPVA